MTEGAPPSICRVGLGFVLASEVLGSFCPMVLYTELRTMGESLTDEPAAIAPGVSSQAQ
jgi:hypothetical protein